MGALKGVPTSVGGQKINHLFFVDDSLIFCKTNREECNCLSGILEMYKKASRQRLNKDKPTIFFSKNTKQKARDFIFRVTGIPALKHFDTYLGLLALVGRSRISEFQSIIERVKMRINNWKTQFLS